MALIDRDALIAKIENDKCEAAYNNDPYVQGIFKGLVIAECFAFDAPAVDAIPVSSLIELRDWLVEHDAITLEGRRWLDNLIGGNKT